MLVEFEDGGVAIVAKSWITPRRKEVFWPPVKQQRHYDRYVKDTVEADTENWKIHKIVRQFYETDDSQKAQKKLKVVQYQSDLASDTDENLPLKRNRKRPLRFSSSVEEAPQEASNKLRRTQINEKGRKKTSTSESNLESSRNSSQSKVYNLNEGNGLDCSYLTIQNQVQLTSTSTELLEETCNNQRCSNIQSGESKTEFEKKVFSALIYIREQINQILEWIKKIKQSKQDSNYGFPEDMPVNFPLNCLEVVAAIENFLEHKINVNALCTHFSCIGGKDVTNQVNNILKAMLSDDIDVNYSFYGKRAGKQAFSHLRLKNIVAGAINKRAIQATDKEIEAAKVWLKHAPERLKIKTNRRQTL